MFSICGFAIQTLLIYIWASLSTIYSHFLRQCLDDKRSVPQRFNSFIDLYEAYFRRGNYRRSRWKQQVRYENFIVRKVLPYLNKRLSTALLRGTEDGIELVKLMEAGVARIFAYSGIDAARNCHFLFLRITESGKYIAVHSLEGVDPSNSETWDAGVDTPLTAQQIRELYELNSKNGAHWRAVSNFSTCVWNAVTSDDVYPD